jgi:hypothetical protein
MPPFALTDADLDAIIRAAAPIEPDDRAAFIEAVVRAIEGRSLAGGELASVAAKVAARFVGRPSLN